MELRLLRRLRAAASQRRLKRGNPDIRRVFALKHQAPKTDARTPPPLSPDQMKQWNEQGFLILRGFIDAAEVQSYRDHIETLWSTRADPENPLSMVSARGRHRFRDAVDDDRAPSYRLLDQYLVDRATRDLCAQPRLMRILHQLMGHVPVVCNSLLFEWGSEQDMHSDMFYMAPLTRNQMLATWIAFDDVTEDNGPLLYVPGSHKMEPFTFSNGSVSAIPHEVAGAVDVIQADMDRLGLKAERFLAKRGDLLIWHSQLMHGGDVIRDATMRRTSLVTHYFSTCDVPAGPWLCAERHDGSLFMIKEHRPSA